jgi:hypothetical protein
MPSRRPSALPSSGASEIQHCVVLGLCRSNTIQSSTLRSASTALCLIVVLAGCAQSPPRKPAPAPAPPPPPVVEAAPAPAPAPPVPAPPRVSDAERLLTYYTFALNLPPDQLALEQERTQRFYNQHRSEFSMMQLVLLRCLPGAGSKDHVQAQEMLSSYLKESPEGSPELRALGLMLRTLLIDNQQLEAQVQAQGQKLRDEARRGDELKQKLDALVETERKLLERSKPQRNE